MHPRIVNSVFISQIATEQPQLPEFICFKMKPLLQFQPIQQHTPNSYLLILMLVCLAPWAREIHKRTDSLTTRALQLAALWTWTAPHYNRHCPIETHLPLDSDSDKGPKSDRNVCKKSIRAAAQQWNGKKPSLQWWHSLYLILRHQ